MSFYDFDITIHIKRFVKAAILQPKQLAWLQSLLEPLRFFQDVFLKRFRDGDNSPKWDNLTVYNIGETVRFRNKVYLCFKQTTAGIDPTNAEYFVLVLDTWIGVAESINYNGQVIMLEYLLNKWFEYSSGEIYIENAEGDDDFAISEEEGESGDIGLSDELTESLIGTSDSFLGDSFTVFFPSADITYANKKRQELEALVVKYKLYGTTPTFSPY